MTSQPTLVLSHSDVVRNIHALSLLDAMRAALLGGTPPPVTTTRAGGTLVVHALESPGVTRALMPSNHVCALAHAVVGALVLDTQGAPSASRVAVLGAGPHTPKHVKMLRLVRSLTHVSIHDPDAVASHNMAHTLNLGMQLPTLSLMNPAEALEDADVVLVLAGAREASVEVRRLPPGALLVAVDPMGPGAAVLAGGSEADGVERVDVADIARASAPGARARSGARRMMVTNAAPERVDAVAAWCVLEAALQDAAVMRLDMDA